MHTPPSGLQGSTAVPQPEPAARRRLRIRPSPCPQHILILAPRSGRWCVRRNFSLLAKHTGTPPRAGPHSQAQLIMRRSAASDSACRPASPVTLPTVPQPARTAPSVVESLSFLRTRDARRVLARRRAHPGRAGRSVPIPERTATGSAYCIFSSSGYVQVVIGTSCP